MARVVVTGGAGFIGSHVADAYLNEGHEVLVIDSLVHGRRENVREDAEFAELDIRDEECARLIREWKPDVINHHAAQMDVRVSVSDPRFDASVNVDGLLNLLEAAREAEVGRFLYVSSGGVVYGEPELRPTPEHMPKLPQSPYGVTKLAGEQYLHYYHRVHGLEYVALRYSNVYGPRQDPHGEAGVVAIFSTRLLEDSPLTIFGDGEQTRDYVYVGDVVAANLLLSGLELPPARTLDDRGFNVGTGVETSVTELATALMDAAGRSVPIEYVEARPGELRHSSLDAARLRALGWSSRTELRTGLANTFEWIADASVARTQG
jgi:UDP-glucose 4-epimerase